ncbi:MAG: ABC transporter permease, partial [Burkholderiales bacterium]
MNDTLKRIFDSDLWYSFKRHPLVIIAAILSLVCILGAVFAPLLAPHNPFDLKTLNLLDAFTPPAWSAAGKGQFLLGTDDQGRDVMSTIMYGSRVSLTVGICAVALSMVIGITLGLISGYVGGALDSFIMRVADVQLSFPAILIALLIDGVARVVIGKDGHDEVAVYVLIFAIAASG